MRVSSNEKTSIRSSFWFFVTSCEVSCFHSSIMMKIFVAKYQFVILCLTLKMLYSAESRWHSEISFEFFYLSNEIIWIELWSISRILLQIIITVSFLFNCILTPYKIIQKLNLHLLFFKKAKSIFSGHIFILTNPTI